MTNNYIEEVPNRSDEIINELMKVWESSVRATHHFLTEKDIQAIKPEAKEAIRSVKDLYVLKNGGALLGFVGVENDKMEMLFVDAKDRGEGFGRQLCDYAINHLNAKKVDVNEENEQGVSFYTHLGFRVVDRSTDDSQGRPFPLLHLEYHG